MSIGILYYMTASKTNPKPQISIIYPSYFRKPKMQKSRENPSGFFAVHFLEKTCMARKRKV